MVGQEDFTHADLWAKLVSRANEDQIFIKWHPVTALLDTGSQVTHVSQAFCLAKGFQIHPISRLLDNERTGDSIKYVGYIKAKLFLPVGSHSFEVEALLLVLPTTEYQKRVPVAIGTTITDMAVDYIGQNSPKNLSQSWKAVFCATQSR